MYSIHILHGTLVRLGSMLKGDINYTMWVMKYVNGGHSGDLNVPLKSKPSILGLALALVWSFVAGMCELCLYALWWSEILIV